MKIVSKNLSLNKRVVYYEVKLFGKNFIVENPQSWDDNVFFKLLIKHINENTF